MGPNANLISFFPTVDPRLNTITTDVNNPWFVLFLVLGILSAMLQAPGYLRRAHISEAGDFLELFAVARMAKKLGNLAMGPEGLLTKLATAGSRMVRQDKGLRDTGALPGASAEAAEGLNRFYGLGSGKQAQNTLGAPPSRSGQGAIPGLTTPSTAGTTAAGARTTLGGQPLGANAAATAGPVGRRFQSPAAATAFAQGDGSQKDPFEDLMQGRHDNAHDVAAKFLQTQVQLGAVDLKRRPKGESGNQLRFDENGNVRQILRDPEATPVETGFQIYHAALANTIRDSSGREDPRLAKAVDDSVRAKSITNPLTSLGLSPDGINAPLWYRVSSWLGGGRVPDHFKALETGRLARAKSAVRDEGALAYLRGEPGNYYTAALNDMYGPFQDLDRARVAYGATNPDSTGSGFNLARIQTIGNLIRSGINITGDSIAAGSHPAITSLRTHDFKEAVPAVEKLITDISQEKGLEGPTGRELQGGAIARTLLASGLRPDSNEYKAQGNALKMAAHEGVARSLDAHQVRAAQAISRIAGLHNVSARMVDAVIATKGIGEGPRDYDEAVQNIVSIGNAVELGSKASPFFGNSSGQVVVSTITPELIPQGSSLPPGSGGVINVGDLGRVSVPVQVDSNDVRNLADYVHKAGLGAADVKTISPYLVNLYAIRKYNQSVGSSAQARAPGGTINQVVEIITEEDIRACQTLSAAGVSTDNIQLVETVKQLVSGSGGGAKAYIDTAPLVKSLVHAGNYAAQSNIRYEYRPEVQRIGELTRQQMFDQSPSGQRCVIPVPMAVEITDIVRTAREAGFRDQDLQKPNVVHAIREIYAMDNSREIMSTANAVYRDLRMSDEFNTGTVMIGHQMNKANVDMSEPKGRAHYMAAEQLILSDQEPSQANIDDRIRTYKANLPNAYSSLPIGTSRYLQTFRS